MTLKIGITGATGFIGGYLTRDLVERGYDVRALLPRSVPLPPRVTAVVIGDIRYPQALSVALDGLDVLIHCAGIAHQSSPDAELYDQVNTGATINLAKEAARSGIGRFIFMSSVAALCGPSSKQIISDDTVPAPVTAYGASKLAAERGLALLSIDWVALRLALVYGPGAKANIAVLAALARSRWPLPLGGLTGRRSLLAVGNLASAIVLLIERKESVRRPLIVADDGALTVPEMLIAIRRGLGRKPLIAPMPPSVIKLACKASGRMPLFQRLNGDLEVNAQGLRGLGWSPAFSTAEGLSRWASKWRPAASTLDKV